MIILNFGIPRSGTVWAFNVFQQIWESQNVVFETVNVNEGIDVEKFAGSVDLSKNLIVHGHDVTPKLVQLAAHDAVRPFYSYRDPRDVVCSQMKLHSLTLEGAIHMVTDSYTFFPKAICLPGIMVIPYDHIREQSEALIFQMATKLGVLLSLQKVKEIAEATSAENHRKIMDQVNETPEDENDSSIETAELNSRAIRFDRKHLITDRHIQSGKTGRWREELSPAQQTLVDSRFTQIVDLLGFEN